ncbi:unnamed protein product [Rotaria sordida]|uniref:Uncharacterized protein n=1 Tax=Rotaria sordida TaxID=392033 RepID=A0A814PHL1_9BILA|nr:unnamed protein product [Rotaria sordida]
MNYNEINIKEEEEEEEKEDIDTFLSNFWLKLNNAKSNKDDLDEILMQLQDIQNQIIVYFKEAACECNVEELKIYENKLLKIKWYADITTMYMINNLSSHQRNHLNFHHKQLIYSKSIQEFDNNTFVQVFNEKQKNTTITRIEITDPIPNRVAAHPVQRQQQQQQHDDDNNINNQQ